MTQLIDLDRPIFEDPPNGLGEQEFHFGLLVVGMGGMEGIEVAWAFLAAGERLLDAAAAKRESWEAAYPILFCYRHALEVYLKALIPGAKKQHGLDNLWNELYPSLDGHFRADHLAWLRDRIMEFHEIDPRATAFRYHDVEPQGPCELWVDFYHLKHKVDLMFKALDRVRLHLLQ